MLIIPPSKYRKNRKEAKQQAMAGPAALVLVSASYDDSAVVLTLQFERAIDISGLNGLVIVLNDNDFNGLSYTGTDGAELLDDVTVQISLASVGDATEPGVVLNVAAGNGIVAVDDGGTWAGAEAQERTGGE